MEKYGLVRNKIDWCEDQSFCLVNSFMRHARRGYGRCYEFYGFLARQNERHGIVKRMRLSYHRTKLLRVGKAVMKWSRSVQSEQRLPKIK